MTRSLPLARSYGWKTRNLLAFQLLDSENSMTARKLGALMLLVIAACSTRAFASGEAVTSQPATSPQALPDAKDLFERHIEAVGGRDAVRKHTSLKFTGTLKIPSMNYSAFTTIWQVAPTTMVMFTEPPGGGRGEVYTDGTNAWELMPTPGGGSKWTLYTDSRKADTLFSADFYGDVNYESRYSKIQTVEMTDFNGQSAYKVFAEATLGKQFFLFFDKASGLILGSHTVQNEAGQTIPIIMVYEPYKEIDGVKYITGVTQRTPSMDVMLAYRVIEPGPQDVPPVEMPAELKVQLAPAPLIPTPATEDPD